MSKEKITLGTLKHLLKWKANQKYPSKARIVFIRNEDMIIEEHLHYKSKEEFKRDKKNYIYEMLSSYNNVKIRNYDLTPIKHWKK